MLLVVEHLEGEKEFFSVLWHDLWDIDERLSDAVSAAVQERLVELDDSMRTRSADEVVRMHVALARELNALRAQLNVDIPASALK